jgi:hypothetical protein
VPEVQRFKDRNGSKFVMYVDSDPDQRSDNSYSLYVGTEGKISTCVWRRFLIRRDLDGILVYNPATSRTVTVEQWRREGAR